MPEDDKAPVKVSFGNGELGEYKRIKKTDLLAMDAIIPGVKDIVNIGTQNLETIAKLGNTPLFCAAGDISKYMRKSDGTYLSSTKGVNGKINGQPGFVCCGYTREGAVLAANIGKVIPYVQIAVMVIEIGYSLFKNHKQLENEEKKLYANYWNELNTDYRMLQEAMDDYYYLNDAATKAAYMDKAVAAFAHAQKKFDDIKRAIGDLKSDKVKMKEDRLKVMQSALVVFSYSCVIKILYSGTECSEYIKKAHDEIDFMTKEYNSYVERCREITSEHNEKKEKSTKIAAMIGLGLLGGTVGAAIGGYFAGKGLAKRTNDKGQRQEEAILELQLTGNPYKDCVSNLYLSLGSDKPILLDDECVYYPVA